MKRSVGLILPFCLLFTLDSVNCRRVIRAKPEAKTTGYFIVKLEKSLSHEEFMHTRDEILKDSDGYPVYEADSDLFKVLTVKVKESMLDQVKHIRGVEYIEEETYAHSTEIPWSLDQIDQCSDILDNNYQPDGDGEGVDIYILDTGIRYSHSEFEGRAKYSGRDPVDEYYGTNQMGLDCQGHGTHVASLAAGKKYGAAKKANLYSVRVLDCGGSAPWSVILNGLNHVAELLNDTVQPAIISMSLGGNYIAAVDDLVTAIVQADIPVVVAAGNDGEDACDYSPASNSLAVTVGASREGAGMYSYSNGGSCVDIIAPGVDVLGASWLCDSCIRFLTGTSMATPLVSGVAAIHLSFQPLLTPSELKQILFDESCKNILNFNDWFAAFFLKLSTPNRLLHIESGANDSFSIELISTTPLPTSALEISVLPFLDLDNDASMLIGVDDSSIQFQFPKPFHFNLDIYTSGHISSNGLISFGSSFTAFSPRLFPINAQVIAPYWDDIDLRNRGSVIFDSFNAQNGQQTLNDVSDFINSVEKTPDLFEASSVIVIYWRDTCPIGSPTCFNTNSFQLVLASSDETSFAVFTYKCGSLNWVRNKASIGYSAGEDFFFNHPLSRRSNVNDIACVNQPFTPWSNVVFNFENDATLSFPSDFLLPTPTPAPTSTAEEGSTKSSNELRSDIPLPTSIGDIDVLPFLDLGSDANNFTGVDDSSVQFHFPQPFQFNVDMFTSGYISSNGLISFGSSFTAYSPSLFPITSRVIAPYWDDIDLRNRGNVIFNSFNAQNGNHILETVSDFINSVERSPNLFEASSVVVVHWRNTCPYEDSTCSSTNSFQVVLASSDETSFAVFTYKCGSLNWVNHRASIGYSAGEDFFFNHPLSRKSNVNDIACINQPLTPWSNVVFNSGSNPLEISLSSISKFLLTTPTRTAEEGTPSPSPSDHFSFSILLSEITDGTSTTSSSSTTTPTPTNAGGCIGRGFQGCCVPGGGVSCYVFTGRCYCDEICHYLRDCCPDILEIGCFDPSAPEIQSVTSDFDLPTATLTVSVSPEVLPSPSLVSSEILSPSQSPMPSINALPFLELNATISVVRFLRGAVDSSELVVTGQQLVIEENIVNRIYVNDNGVISLNKPFLFWQPAPFPTFIQAVQSSNVFAVYWSDVDNRHSGEISYQVYSDRTDAEEERLNLISQYIEESQSTNFSGTWALLVDWNGVHPFDHQAFVNKPLQFQGPTADFLNSTNSYQAIIITDSFDSYVIYTYKCDLLQWTGPEGYHAVVGYNIQGLPARNEPHSGTVAIGSIDCGNQPSSQFRNIVYRFEGKSDTTLLQCLSARNTDRDEFTNFPALFFFIVPDCPCSLFQAASDFRYFQVFSVFPRLCYSFFWNILGPTNLCCYSINILNFGSLITSGAGASTYIVGNPFFTPSTFSQFDIDFNRACCVEGDYCDIFFNRRPKLMCAFYLPPFFTWNWGDPHFRTLDGRRYTFNGLGEYILTDINGIFQLQARTAIAGNSTATVFSAFAATDLSENSEQVQAEITSDGNLVIRLNGSDISESLSNINDSFIGRTVMLTRNTNDTIVASFQSTVAVEFSLSVGVLSAVTRVPPQFNGTLSGLLGNFDGNAANDFMYRNGTIAIDSITDREKHVVAQTWQVSEEESLFFYEDGQNVSTMSDPYHQPIFLDEIDNVTLSEAADICGGVENVECLFDFSQTRNKELAQATVSTDSKNNEIQQIVANFPPVIRAADVFYIDVNKTSTYSVNVTDPGDSFNVTIVSDTGTLPEIMILKGSQDGEYNFSILLNEVALFTFSIVATDTMGSTSSIQPQIHICGCQNGGNCTAEGIIDVSKNPLLLSCICPEAWTGMLCTEDVDGCSEVSCFQDATCEDVPAPMTGAICPECPLGYEGDGQKCFDIDECANTTINVCQHLCVNNEGSFRCDCNQGFELSSDKLSCQDVNECSTNQHDCEHLCENSVGSFNCTCQLGFLLDSDGRRCNPDPNRECPDDNKCEQLCSLEVDGESGLAEDPFNITCSCLNGYNLDENKANCTDIDECASIATNPCEHNCLNNEGGFSCSCMTGYSQNGFFCDDINECIVQVNPCGEFQLCQNRIGSFACQCIAGLELNDDTQRCQDIDECATSNPCDHNCSNAFGSFSCSCREGFQLQSNGRTCSNINECLLAFPCPSGQLCVDNEGSFICVCPDGLMMNSEGSCIAEGLKVSSSPMEILSSSIPITKSQMTMSTTMMPSPPLTDAGQTLRITLQIVNQQNFTSDLQERFRNAIADAINSYCTQNAERCRTISTTGRAKRWSSDSKRLHKRQVVFVSANDIVIRDIENTAEGVVVIIFVRGMNGGVISAQTVLEAVQEQKAELATAGFTVVDIIIAVSITSSADLSTLSSPQLSLDSSVSKSPTVPSNRGFTTEVVAITISAVLIGAFVIGILTLIIFCLMRKKRSAEKECVEKESSVVIKNVIYETDAILDSETMPD